MTLISVEEYLKHIKPALMKVFKDCIFLLDGASQYAFQDAIDYRACLFTYKYAFSDDSMFWNAVSSAILELGDTEIFVIDTVEEYCQRYTLASDRPLPNLCSSSRAIFSLQGNWGILFDVKRNCFIGGAESFIHSMRKHLPEIYQDYMHTWRVVSAAKCLEKVSPESMKALMKVFKDCIFPICGATSCPFQDAIEARAFLFDDGDGSYLDNPIFWNALSSAILENGDTEIFIIDTVAGFYTKYTLDSDKPLPDLSGSDRAICSLQGNWGILFDIEGIGLIGGSTSFIENIRKDFPEIDDQFSNLLTTWKSSGFTTDNEWLPDTLIHVFGETKGKELLEEARKMDVYRVSNPIA